MFPSWVVHVCDVLIDVGTRVCEWWYERSAGDSAKAETSVGMSTHSAGVEPADVTIIRGDKGSGLSVHVEIAELCHVRWADLHVRIDVLVEKIRNGGKNGGVS